MQLSRDGQKLLALGCVVPPVLLGLVHATYHILFLSIAFESYNLSLLPHRLATLELVADVGATVVDCGGGVVAENSRQAMLHRKPVPPDLEKGFHHVPVYEENNSFVFPVKVILPGRLRGLQNRILLRKEGNLKYVSYKL